MMLLGLICAGIAAGYISQGIQDTEERDRRSVCETTIGLAAAIGILDIVLRSPGGRSCSGNCPRSPPVGRAV